MRRYHGHKIVKGLYHGDTRIKAMYKGDELIWSSECVISVDAPHTTLTEGTVVNYGSPYTANIAAESGYTLINVVVTMGGEVISAYSEGVISIARVTGDVTIEAIASAPIVFQDANVKSLCVNNWGGNYIDDEITEWEAAQVTSVGTVFKSNTTIVYFDEFEYFTGIQSLYETFTGCSALKQIKIPHTTYDGSFSMHRAFNGCSALQSLDMSPMKENTAISSIYDTFNGCSALTTLTLPTTNKINAATNQCFRGIGCTELDLSPWAGSHLTLQSYCFWGFTNMERIITTGVYINGANDSVSMGGSKVTEIIGGFMGWNKNMTLTSYGSLTHESALDIIDGLATVTEKTITFSSATYGTLTSDEAAIAVNKGWVGAGLWQKTKINGIKIPFGFFSVISGINALNVTSNITPQLISNGVDVTSTAFVNGKITIPDNKVENEFNFTTNSNSGTITFSGTTDTGMVNSSRFFFSASQNGWYKVTLNIDANTTVLGTSAKSAALIVRRYSPYNTRYNGSIDYDYWEFVNVESFVAGSTIEAYGYMGVGDVLTTFDTLDGSCTFTVDLVEAIAIPTGYAIPLAMQSGLDIIQVTPGLRINHSIETKFKITEFSQGQYWVGMYDSTLRKYYLGRTGGTGYALGTYWGKGVANPPTSALVNSDMINNVMYFRADSTKYLVKRLTNGTQYGANYPAQSMPEATAEYFYVRRSHCFWLKLRDNGTLVRNLVPLVDTETREYYRLYDLVEGVFFDRPRLLLGGSNSGNGDLIMED